MAERWALVVAIRFSFENAELKRMHISCPFVPEQKIKDKKLIDSLPHGPCANHTIKLRHKCI